MVEQPKYDGAVSFLAQDEPLALELSQTLAGRMTLFVYSERQRDLAGREGMSEFTRIFDVNRDWSSCCFDKVGVEHSGRA